LVADFVSAALPIKHKVLCYVTHGPRLLLMAHPDHADAGIQVPAGTIEADEAPHAAALRETAEETGLLPQSLTVAAAVGTMQRDMRDVGMDAIHQRHYFHVRYSGPVRALWDHVEQSPSTGGGPIRLRFFWVALAAVHRLPPLIADHGAWVGRVVVSWPAARG
jgi:8-oxo-dGTP pyrophosphatase MutT (NUDIX family)